jgi:hypothetical protein
MSKAGCRRFQLRPDHPRHTTNHDPRPGRAQHLRGPPGGARSAAVRSTPAMPQRVPHRPPIAAQRIDRRRASFTIGRRARRSCHLLPLTPALHHAAEPQAVDKDFSTHSVLWDRVSGTCYMPARWPERYGLSGPHGVPAGWARQFIHPFRSDGRETWRLIWRRHKNMRA